MNFRYDINGLRAIAVIAVVLFHFNPAWVPGGFAGVDVFFVISGFLMTSIIFRGLENDNFNLFKFYVARANRIIPALAVLCLVLLLFGWFYLNPLDYKTLGKHVASSMGFLSNIIYWRESGYFDAASHEKWLLYTWSLSVEWQFYIIYPIILVALKRFLSLESLKRLIVAGTVLGFGLSVVATMKQPDAAYYLLPTRAWEMMMGGVAFLYPWNVSDTKKKLLEVVGLLLILTSYTFVSSDIPWPGHFALVPVLGAYLMIVANQQSSMVTNNKFFQYLGKWSYSIYLWHWPIVVFGYYFDNKNWYLYGLPLSFFLGFLSFKFVESLKFKSYLLWKDTFRIKPVYLVFFITFLSCFVFVKMPNKYLYPLSESIISSIERKPYQCFDKELMHEHENVTCKLTSGSVKVLAVGDSHSYASLPAVEIVAKENDLALYYTGFSGCPPIIDVLPIRSDQHLKNCKILNEKAVQFVLDNNISKVFLAARWTYYTEGEYSRTGMQYLTQGEKIKSRENSVKSFKRGLKKTFDVYHDNNVDVVLMLQVPMQESNPDKIYYKSMSNNGLDMKLLDKNSISKIKSRDFQSDTNSIIMNLANKYSNVTVLDPSLYLCSGEHCLVGNDVFSYYFDDDHLSTMGAKELIKPIHDALVN